MGFFKRIIFHVLTTAGVLWGIENYVFPEDFSISGGISAYLLVAFLFGLLNATIKPILKILTFPVKILTLGVSSLFLNAGLLWAWKESINFLEINHIEITITDLKTYLLVGIILSLASAILHWFEGK